MLYINAVQPTGLFSYGSSELIRLNESKLVNLIGVNEDKNGDSNGSGKTSLFNAICRILFGEDPTGVKSAEVTNKLWGHGFAGRVEFTSWEGIPYRVTDCRDWKESNYYPNDNDNQAVYKGTHLFFDRWDGSRWVDNRADGRTATRKRIIKAVGMSYSRFLAISYMSHRIGSKFLRGKDAERMDVLSGISGVEEWDKKDQDFRNKRKPVNKDISDKTTALTYKEGQLAMLQQQLKSLLDADWEGVIKQTHISLATVDKDIAAAQQIVDSTKTRCNLAIIESQQQNPEAEKLGQGRQQLVQQQATFRAQSDAPIVETSEMQAMRDEINRLHGIQQSYSGEVNLTKLKECPTCGHKVTKAQKDKITKKLKEVDNSLKAQQAQLNAAWLELNKADKEKQTNILGQIVDLTKQINQVDQQLTRFNDQRTAATTQLTQVNEEFTRVTTDLNNRIHEKARLEKQLADYQLRKTEVDRAKATVEESTNEIKGLKGEVQVLQNEVAIYDWFRANIPYIKLHKLSLTMKLLSDKTNHYFEDMGDTTRINISPFSEKKTKKGGDLKDLMKGDVHVEITDGVKNIDPRLYSDGETAKIANALIRALHDIATSYGHGCNLVLLDEIFSFVDNNNSQKLAESFNGNLASMTLVTDNSGVVNDLMTFDETWVARKKNGITQLELQNG